MKIKKIDIRDIDGFHIGNAEDAEGGTGCTVIISEEGAVAGVDVRGGAPATRETDLLKSENTVEKINAVVISGGSAFGLESASGVMRALSAKGIGFRLFDVSVPIVAGASLFDLPVGRSDVFPDVAMGIQAVDNAYNGVFESGNHGAGTGASCGKMLGMGRAMKTGLGTFACGDDLIQVGAVVAVNACADIYNGAGNIIAGLRTEDGSSILGTIKVLKNAVHPEPAAESSYELDFADLIAADKPATSAAPKVSAPEPVQTEAAPSDAPQENDIAKAIRLAYEKETSQAAEPAAEPEDSVNTEPAAEAAVIIPAVNEVQQEVVTEVQPEQDSVYVPETAAETPANLSVPAAEVPAESDTQPQVSEDSETEPSEPVMTEETETEVPAAPAAIEVQAEPEDIAAEPAAEPVNDEAEPVADEIQQAKPEQTDEPVKEEIPEDPYKLSQEEIDDMGYDIPFNTTVGCLITNAKITKSQANKLASILHDAYARAIKPVHSTMDGDTIFVMSTCTQEVNFDAFAALATDVMQYAVIDGAHQAEEAYGLPASRDIIRK